MWRGVFLITSSAVQFLPYIIVVTLISLSSPGMFTYGDILRNLFFFFFKKKKDANRKYNPYFERTSHFFSLRVYVLRPADVNGAYMLPHTSLEINKNGYAIYTVLHLSFSPLPILQIFFHVSTFWLLFFLFFVFEL